MQLIHLFRPFAYCRERCRVVTIGSSFLNERCSSFLSSVVLLLFFLIIFLFLPLPRYHPISFSLLRFASCFFFLAFFTSYHRFNGLSILIEAGLLARAAKHRNAYKISINRHPEGRALLFLVARTKAKLFDYVIGLPAAPVIIVAAVLSSLRTNSYFRQ